ncbi:MAG: hypothetical protein JWN52_2173 [Actinomycetia bacterium]|nr:hypothetical protein [Actinomycetes bacterium]
MPNVTYEAGGVDDHAHVDAHVLPERSRAEGTSRPDEPVWLGGDATSEMAVIGLGWRIVSSYTCSGDRCRPGTAIEGDGDHGDRRRVLAPQPVANADYPCDRGEQNKDEGGSRTSKTAGGGWLVASGGE